MIYLTDKQNAPESFIFISEIDLKDIEKGDFAVYTDSPELIIDFAKESTLKHKGLIYSNSDTFSTNRISEHVWHIQLAPPQQATLSEIVSLSMDLINSENEYVHEGNRSDSIGKDKSQDSIDSEYSKWIGASLAKLVTFTAIELRSSPVNSFPLAVTDFLFDDFFNYEAVGILEKTPSGSFSHLIVNGNSVESLLPEQPDNIINCHIEYNRLYLPIEVAQEDSLLVLVKKSEIQFTDCEISFFKLFSSLFPQLMSCVILKRNFVLLK